MKNNEYWKTGKRLLLDLLEETHSIVLYKDPCTGTYTKSGFSGTDRERARELRMKARALSSSDMGRNGLALFPLDIEGPGKLCSKSGWPGQRRAGPAAATLRSPGCITAGIATVLCKTGCGAGACVHSVIHLAQYKQWWCFNLWH